MHDPEKKYLYKDYAFKDEGRLIPHPKRMINNHIMYLEHYKCFFNEVEGIFSLTEKTTIIEKVDQVINRYKSNYNELVEGYGHPGGGLLCRTVFERWAWHSVFVEKYQIGLILSYM